MPHGDIDGRDRIPWNVLTSWSCQFVQIVSGFILPRLIDDRLGQLQLGVWDFAWSMVAYFGLLQAGVVSSVNRYVAMYRAQGNSQNVNRVVNSVTCILSGMGLVIILLSIASSWGVGYFMDEQLATARHEAQWVVLLLGVHMAIHVSSSAFGAILTGCHRWGLHNLIFAVTNAMILIGSIVMLMLGKGLIALAIINLCSETFGRGLRWIMAYRVCPELQLRWQYIHWRTALTMLGFGSKIFIPHLGHLLLNQAINIMILAHLGPAVLALYARPKALIRHVMTLLQKYALVFVPTVSSLQETGNHNDIQELVIKATHYGACISLPLILVLVISGDNLLHVWMGEQYSQPLLIAILTLGHLTQLSFMPLFSILSGLNLHGRPGVANLLAAGTALCLVYLALQHFHTGLPGVALAVGLPLTVANGVYLPLYACRVLGLSLRELLIQAWRVPIACAIPFSLCLISGKWFYSHSPALVLAWGLGSGSIAISLCYWRYIIPAPWKKKLVLQVSSLFFPHTRNL